MDKEIYQKQRRHIETEESGQFQQQFENFIKDQSRDGQSILQKKTLIQDQNLQVANLDINHLMQMDQENSRSNMKQQIHSLKGFENLVDNLSPLLRDNNLRYYGKHSFNFQEANNQQLFTQKQSQTEFDVQETQTNQMLNSNNKQKEYQMKNTDEQNKKNKATNVYLNMKNYQFQQIKKTQFDSSNKKKEKKENLQKTVKAENQIERNSITRIRSVFSPLSNIKSTLKISPFVNKNNQNNDNIHKQQMMQNGQNKDINVKIKEKSGNMPLIEGDQIMTSDISRISIVLKKIIDDDQDYDGTQDQELKSSGTSESLLENQNNQFSLQNLEKIQSFMSRQTDQFTQKISFDNNFKQNMESFKNRQMKPFAKSIVNQTIDKHEQKQSIENTDEIK